MAESDPGDHAAASREAQERQDQRHNLLLRVLSAAVLAPLALAAAYFGGVGFAIFWGVAAVAVLWEWMALATGAANRLVFYVGASALLLAVVIAERQRPGISVLIIILGALAAVVFAPAERRAWIAGGVCYAGIMLMAPLVLRSDAEFGLLALLMLFAVVWATDVLGYFVGRAFGGPKLAPRMSPKKTWSGALGGTIAAIIVALVVARIANLPDWPLIAGIALLLSAASQAGDIFESALKRRFGAKDSSHLIPGHGGVMDRLDGFWAASLIAVIIGLTRGGFDAPARALLVW